MLTFKVRSYGESMNAINQADIDVSYFGLLDGDSSWKSADFCSPFTRVYMILDGEADLVCKGETIKMRPGNIYILPAGMTFAYNCDKYIKKLFFHINVTLSNKYDWFNYIDECIIMEDMAGMIGEIFNMVQQNSLVEMLRIKEYIYTIVNYCFTKHKETLVNLRFAYSRPVLAAIAYIEKHLTANLTIQQIAENCNISIPGIKKKFKAEMNISLGKYIDDRLMTVAERRLRTEDISIKDLSNSLGFCDQFYFSEKFKKTFRIPPRVYRQHF